MEIILVFLYVTIVLLVPPLLSVNRLSTRFVSILIFPLFLVSVPDKGSVFNPGALYALWFVNNRLLSSAQTSLQLEHLVSPLLGAVLAGLFCSYALPDDNGSWIRNRKIL